MLADGMLPNNLPLCAALLRLRLLLLLLLQVSAHPDCIVRITISSPSRFFKVTGLALLAYTDQLQRTVLDEYLHI
jgi:hypothetical protein